MYLLAAFGLVGAAVLGFAVGHARARAVAGGGALHSRPGYHGGFVALAAFLPGLALVAVALLSEPGVAERVVRPALPSEVQALPGERLASFLGDAQRLADGRATIAEPDTTLRDAAARFASFSRAWRGAVLALVAALALGGILWARARIRPDFRARTPVERCVLAALALCALVAVASTAGIVLSLVFETARFFAIVPPGEFFFGLQWSPQTALRADQVGSSGAFGAVPIFAGTLLITTIAMAVAAPAGLFAAIYLAEYAPVSQRVWVKPLLEILAGIPTVVYGFFAAVTIGPWIRSIGFAAGLDVATESALAAGLVMGVMIVPYVSSLSDDVINAVPQSLRDASYGLGATPSETIRLVVLPAALPGIVGALLLGDLARDRRDDDRRDGGRSGGEPHGEPAAGRHDGDRADRDAARRGPGVRQREDAGGFRARARACSS